MEIHHPVALALVEKEVEEEEIPRRKEEVHRQQIVTTLDVFRFMREVQNKTAVNLGSCSLNSQTK